MIALAAPGDRFRHDPTSLLLPVAGAWPAAEAQGVTVHGPRGLRLLPGDAPAGLAAGEASLGGLVAPAHVAVDRAGNVFALDRAEARLCLVDPYDCSVRVLPCFGGAGDGPRQLNDPRAIAAGRRSLYVADTGNARVAVLDIGSWQLRRLLTDDGWSPVDVAVAPGERLLVADAHEGAVLAFSSGGRPLGAVVSGVAGIVRVAVDAAGRIYVGVAGEPGVRVYARDGSAQGLGGDVVELTGRFTALPFDVLADGSIDLGADCVLDARLARTQRSTPPGGSYAIAGRLVTQALDSGLPGCQWHRLVGTGRMPGAGRITVRTAAADLPGDSPAATDRRWSRPVSVRGPADAGWDALVLAGPGRYLWVELELRGDSAVTPELATLEIEYPRVSLRRHLPAVFAEDAVARDFLDRFLAVFDTGFRSVERQLDDQAAWFDLRSAPAGRPDVLGWLASWLGLAADASLGPERRRTVLLAMRDALPMLGTAAGLRRVLLARLGMDASGSCTPPPRGRCAPLSLTCGVTGLTTPAWTPPPLILEHFTLRRWLFLGPSRIGDQAHLWGNRIVNRSQLGVAARAGTTQLITSQDPMRDPFHHYAHRFSVFVPARAMADERERRALTRLIREESPAHTAFQLEPVAPRLRIGVQATIGFDAVVGRWPRDPVLVAPGVPAERSRLGGLVLGGRRPARELVVGVARTSSTTRIE